MTVVIMKYESVNTTTLPMPEPDSVRPMVCIRTNKTKGTTTNLMRFNQRAPMIPKATIFSWKMNPATIPPMRAMNIHVVRDIADIFRMLDLLLFHRRCDYAIGDRLPSEACLFISDSAMSENAKLLRR